MLCTVEFSCILTWLKLGIIGRHSRGLHSHDLITSPKSHLLIPLHWVLGFQRMNLEGTQTFSPLYSLTSFSSFLSSTLFYPGGGVFLCFCFCFFFNSPKEKLIPIEKPKECGPTLFLSSIFINSELQIRNAKLVWKEKDRMFKSTVKFQCCDFMPASSPTAPGKFYQAFSLF